MNILITGATGFIASHTIVELQKSGHNIIGVDNLSNSSADIVDKIACVETDYYDKPLTEQKIASITVDTFGVEYPEPEIC